MPGRSAAAGADSPPGQGRIPADQLLLAVESELIPRLMMSARLSHAHEAAAAGASEFGTSVASRKPTQRGDIARLVELARHNDGRGMDRIVDAALDRGVDITKIFVELLAPAAQQLGDDWLADRISFVDVHIGLLALREQVVRYEVSTPRVTGHERSILLASAPQDQHTFGITLVSDCFQRAGWYVRNGCGAGTEELAAVVAEREYTCVGFSLYCDTQVEALRQCIAAVRAASLNPDLIVLVGGSSFVGMAEPAKRVGADLCVDSAEVAVDAANVLTRTLTLAVSRGDNVSLAEG